MIILCGDVPLISYGTLMRLFEDHFNAKRDISVLAVELDNPRGDMEGFSLMKTAGYWGSQRRQTLQRNKRE